MKIPTMFFAVLALAGSVFAGTDPVPAITHQDLQAAIAARKVTLLDVNGTESHREGRIPGAIDFSAHEARLAAVLPKDKHALVVAYCGNEYCNAYETAAQAAIRLGYKNVKHYAPGIDGWKKSGAKIEKG